MRVSMRLRSDVMLAPPLKREVRQAVSRDLLGRRLPRVRELRRCGLWRPLALDHGRVVHGLVVIVEDLLVGVERHQVGVRDVPPVHLVHRRH
eukprot:12775795-Alexandrium_andersonii.AAC.1